MSESKLKMSIHIARRDLVWVARFSNVPGISGLHPLPFASHEPMHKVRADLAESFPEATITVEPDTGWCPE